MNGVSIAVPCINIGMSTCVFNNIKAESADSKNVQVSDYIYDHFARIHLLCPQVDDHSQADIWFLISTVYLFSKKSTSFAS